MSNYWITEDGDTVTTEGGEPITLEPQMDDSPPVFIVDPTGTGTPTVGQTDTTVQPEAIGSPDPTVTVEWVRCTTP